MGKMDDTGKALEKNINSNIEFDTSVLQEKNETYSSLTDTYGIDLFTDQYEEKIEKVHLKEYDAYQKIEKKLFETDLESGKDEYERIQDQLFLYTGSEVKKEEIEKEDNALGVNIAITGIMLILFFFIFFLYYLSCFPITFHFRRINKNRYKKQHDKCKNAQIESFFLTFFSYLLFYLSVHSFPLYYPFMPTVRKQICFSPGCVIKSYRIYHFLHLKRF